MQVVVSLDKTLDKSRRRIEFRNKPFSWTKVLDCLVPPMDTQNNNSYKSFFFYFNYVDHRSDDLLCKHHLLPLTQTNSFTYKQKLNQLSKSSYPLQTQKHLFSHTASCFTKFSLRKRCPKLYKDRCKKLKRVVLLFDLRAKSKPNTKTASSSDFTHPFTAITTIANPSKPLFKHNKQTNKQKRGNRIKREEI